MTKTVQKNTTHNPRFLSHWVKNIVHKTGSIVYALIVLIIVAFTFLFLGTKSDMLGYQVKIVQSGSMEPAVSVGGIVVISPSSVYKVGDIITFGKDTRGSIPVTHRVVEKTGEGKDASYVTKGDANEDKDPRAVSNRSIIGKVVLTVPYIGYLIEFARTPLGFLLLIGIPAIVIVLDEFANITWEIHKYRNRRKQKKGTITKIDKTTTRMSKKIPPSAASSSCVNKQYI